MKLRVFALSLVIMVTSATTMASDEIRSISDVLEKVKGGAHEALCGKYGVFRANKGFLCDIDLIGHMAFETCAKKDPSFLVSQCGQKLVKRGIAKVLEGAKKTIISLPNKIKDEVCKKFGETCQ